MNDQALWEAVRAHPLCDVTRRLLLRCQSPGTVTDSGDADMLGRTAAAFDQLLLESDLTPKTQPKKGARRRNAALHPHRFDQHTPDMFLRAFGVVPSGEEPSATLDEMAEQFPSDASREEMAQRMRTYSETCAQVLTSRNSTLEQHQKLIDQMSAVRPLLPREVQYRAAKFEREFDSILQCVNASYIYGIASAPEDSTDNATETSSSASGGAKSDDNGTTKQKKRRAALPKSAVQQLKHWLFAHFAAPYPTEDDKLQLAARTGLTASQITYWFINARARVWRPMVDRLAAEMQEKRHQQRQPSAAGLAGNSACTD
ncbi:MAG: hypothetical protein MHM6MM_005294 [Cercozoa sp. M6MM]